MVNRLKKKDEFSVTIAKMESPNSTRRWTNWHTDSTIEIKIL